MPLNDKVQAQLSSFLAKADLKFNAKFGRVLFLEKVVTKIWKTFAQKKIPATYEGQSGRNQQLK